MASGILKEQHIEGLQKLRRASCWDPLQLQVVDVEGKSEVFSKTVEMVISSNNPPSVLFMLNTEDLMKSKADGYWPNFKLMRRSDVGGKEDIVAQIQTSLEVQEFQGLPNQFPGMWYLLGRGYTNKAVVGVVMDNPEEKATTIQDYIAACVEVARGKLGAEVEIMIYVNKILEVGEENIMKDMHSTSLSSATVFSSSHEVTVTSTAETGVGLSITATGCSKCNVGFHKNLTREQHEEVWAHKRNQLYSSYERQRAVLLKNPHDLNLLVSVVPSEKEEKKDEPTVSTTEAGLVEVICKPHQMKEFKICLKNNSPNTLAELSENGGLIIEDLGLLRGEEVVELTDEHNLSQPSQETKIRLKPQKRYKVNGKFTGASIGQIKVPVMVTFYHESRSERVGESYRPARMVVEILFKVQDDEVRSLLPEVTFKPVEASTNQWMGRKTIRGRPLPKPAPGSTGAGDSLEVKLPLGDNRISGVRVRAIEGRLERPGSTPGEVEEVKKCLEITSKELSIENYADKWDFLLHCERVQEEKDIRCFDMEGKKLLIDKMDGLLALEVPGLLEGRPSLIKGDKVFLTLDFNTEFEGIVHRVEKTRVFLGVSHQIRPKVKDESVLWKVRFHVSPHSWNNMHRAVKLSQQSNLNKILFPAISDLPLLGGNELELSYYDDKVANNPEQVQAVTAIVAGRSGRVPYLVFGPPGTGKTVTLVEAIRQVWKMQEDTHILACAPSNTAADLLTVRLRRHNHIPEDQILRLNALSRPNNLIPNSLRPCSNIGGDGHYIPPLAVLSKYRIIVCTLVTAGKLASAVFPQDHFNHVFIDEAGQATEPETCIALAGILASDLGQLVMAGDPQQLGPVVRSSLAEKFGLSISLLERLMAGAPYYNSDTGNLDSRCVTKLIRNFRSHQSLIALPAKLFYKDELVPCAESELVNNCLGFTGLTEASRGKTPFLFHGIIGQDTRDASSPSFFNPEEVVTVLDYVNQLLEDSDLKMREEDIGIISPYRGQCQKIRMKLGDSDITVGTTEEFQGQERRVIILSTVRSNPDYVQIDQVAKIGFLKDKKRFNVAITRSQALLIVIGNPNILYQDTEWRQLLDYAQMKECYKGCPFPKLTEELGTTETRLANQLLEEEMEATKLGD